jgi:hypothetical protein
MPYCASCGLSLSQGAMMCPACGEWGCGSATPSAEAAPAPPAAAARRAAGVAPPAPIQVAPTQPTPGLTPPPAQPTEASLESYPVGRPSSWTAAQPLANVSPPPRADQTDSPPWSATQLDSQSPMWSPQPDAQSSWASGSPTSVASRPTAPQASWTLSAALVKKLLIGLICLVVVVGFARGVMVGNVVHLAFDATRPTLSEYQRLQTGQSYQQVDAIFGGNLGLDQTSANNNNVHFTYGSSASLNLSFTDGILQSFSEHGLGTGPSLGAYTTTGVSVAIFTLIGGLADAVAWWLILYIVAVWRGFRPTFKQLATLAAASLAIGLIAPLLLPALLCWVVGLVVFFSFLAVWTHGDIAEALIIAVVSSVVGTLAVYLPTMVGLQIALMFHH